MSQSQAIEEKVTTCQVCGRPICSKLGVIAHHGYRRPHHQGYQTRSCEGARYLPYEVSCDRLKEVLGRRLEFLAELQLSLFDFINNPPAKVSERSDWSGQTIEAERPAVYEKFKEHDHRSYEGIYSRQRYARERDIRYLEGEIREMQGRLAAWKAPQGEVK